MNSNYGFNSRSRLAPNTSSIYLLLTHLIHCGAGKGGKGGGCPPNVEKDGSRNSSKFDEKIKGGGWVSISDVKKS